MKITKETLESLGARKYSTHWGVTSRGYDFELREMTKFWILDGPGGGFSVVVTDVEEMFGTIYELALGDGKKQKAKEIRAALGL